MINFPDLKDKKILITGASRGIGKEIAKSLAAQGAHVLFNHRGNEEKANILKAEFEACGGKASPLHFDVTNSAQIKTAIDAFTSEHGNIEGLVNNAGISKDQLLMRLKEEDLDSVLDTNLKGAILVTQALSRGFMRTPGASIVNISSVVGLMGNPGQGAYSASKAGLIGFTKTVAKEFASKQVRANAICPGFIRTDMTDALDEKVKENYLSVIPLKEFGKTDDVSNLVCFLLSSASSYITGEVIKIDGGLYI